METPVVNKDGMLAKKLNGIKNNLQNHKNRKQSLMNELRTYEERYDL